jgi:hypothetical protein
MEGGRAPWCRRPVLRRVCIPALLALTIAGCGEAERASQQVRPAAPSGPVVDVMQRYLQAANAGRGDEVCSLMTPSLRVALERKAAAGGTTCPLAISTRARTIDEASTPRDRERRKRLVEDRHAITAVVRGQRAWATLTVDRTRLRSWVQFQRLAEGWRIARFGARPPRG